MPESSQFLSLQWINSPPTSEDHADDDHEDDEDDSDRDYHNNVVGVNQPI